MQAAQGDSRSNVLQAPKVTLYNGQQATVSDTTQEPFVVSVIPVVGDFAAAQQPVIVVLSEGTSLDRAGGGFQRSSVCATDGGAVLQQHWPGEHLHVHRLQFVDFKIVRIEQPNRPKQIERVMKAELSEYFHDCAIAAVLVCHCHDHRERARRRHRAAGRHQTLE